PHSTSGAPSGTWAPATTWWRWSICSTPASCARASMPCWPASARASPSPARWFASSNRRRGCSRAAAARRRRGVASMGVQPVAVVGVGCRFAGGADSPQRFWQLLVRGGDGIGELPGGRWAPYAQLGADFATTLRRATRFGGFLPDIEGFDAEFFGLSPRE